jgi:predicted nucleic acid-binding protein
MRRYLLDTTPLTAYLYNRQPAISLISPWIVNDEVATSILVYGEIIEHIKGSAQFATQRQQLKDLLAAIPPHFLTYPILERYADIRRSLRPPLGKGLIGDIDTLIAATALERRLTVVTTDSDFQRVGGLSVLLLDRRTLRPLPTL